MNNDALIDLKQQTIFLTEINRILAQQNTIHPQIARRKPRPQKKLASKKFQKKNSSTKSYAAIQIITTVIIAVAVSFVFENHITLDEQNDKMTSRYVTENLRGDTVSTAKAWHWVKGNDMAVTIKNDAKISEEKLYAVKDAILSQETIYLDDSITHKGPKGSTSKYYLGWQGVLDHINEIETKYYLPSNFKISDSKTNEGRIVIVLSNLKDSDGYTGYTKSILDGEEILKSTITIFDANNLSSEELATIVRHEFGHALGLAHSTAPEDLMAPQISTPHPYISECNVDAILQLYMGNKDSLVTCQK